MRHILLIVCDDQKGLVAKVTSSLFGCDVNIISNREFVDAATGRFFMRTAFEGQVNVAALSDHLKSILPEGAQVSLSSNEKKRLVVLATKEPHCLGDILIRCAFNSLNATISAVICNHEKLRQLVERFDVPFHYVPHGDKTRFAHAAEIDTTLEKYHPDYLVLAKYMRILPSEFVERYTNRIINIHHSFLPAFVGANPYRQAFDRGVKIIGATAHFVNADLDQGPIIVQDVIHVNHRYTARDMSSAGKDVEKTVLSKALNLVVNESVMANGNKTVVFD
jgi:formyltetrahydrofolate deformylase